MGVIFAILILFSILWIFVWIWFFKGNKISSSNLYKVGNKAFENKDYKKAKKILSLITDSLEAKYKLGITHFNLGEYEQSRGCFEQILKNSPKNFDALFNLAKTLEAEKNITQALEFYNKALGENPKKIECYLSIGNLYQYQGDCVKAIETLEKALEFEPDNTNILFNIIKCKGELIDPENQEEYQKIIEEYINISDRSDLPLDFHFSFAKTYAKSGEIERSLEYCQKAIALNSEDIEAYQLLGLIQLLRQDVEGAKNSLAVALSFQPSNKETHNIFSYVLCQNVTSCTLNQCRENYYKLIKKHLK